MQGGVVPRHDDAGIVMLASLYYEPLWIFHRDAARFGRLNEFAGRRITVGLPGSGTRTFALPLLAANGITPDNATFIDAGSEEALQLLVAGRADIVMLVGGGAMDTIQRALHAPGVTLMSVQRAAAYARRFPHITRLVLPAGTVDLARDLPPNDVEMVATEAMLVAREGLHPALVNLLLEVVRDAHDDQGYFEAAGEFPNTTQVDIPVSPAAVRHTRFGTSFLYRTFPFWVATFLDRIERAVTGIRVPASFASEAYTLREHVGLVRRAIVAKAATMDLPLHAD